MAPAFPIFIMLGYLLIGGITHYLCRVYSVMMVVLEGWGNRRKLDSHDYHRAWLCYEHYPNPLFSYEGFSAVYWPIFWVIGILFFVIDLVHSVWKRYIVNMKLPTVKSQYRLTPSWLSKEALIKHINRFI